MLPALLFAQRSARATSRLRATALLEVSNGRARLVPIAIKIGDKFYDAGLYHADPRPMALDSGVVYEAARAGDSVGLFTVTSAQDLKGVWVGLGQWRPNDMPQPEKKEMTPAGPLVDTDAPPVLRRPHPVTPEGNTNPPAPTPSETTPTSGESKPASPESKPANAPPPSSVSKKSPPVPPDSEEDSERPILRRGKPTGHEANDGLPPTILEKPGAAHSTPAAAPSGNKGTAPGPVEVLTAVSDATGPGPRPYLMQLNQDERARYEQSARKLAYEAIRKFAGIRPQHKPAAAGELVDVQFRVYDAHYNNEPDLILSASLPELLPRGAQSGFRYFVTVVARVDMYGETHQLLGSVTDSTHLDAYPRLEFVDVVDAEGSGSGQLLLRQISDRGYSYILYRIGLDKLWPLFEGAGRSF
jgi:hypothetical protein